jgi:hypothetical protein
MSLGIGIHPNTAKITMGKFGPAYHLIKKAQDAVYKELETSQHKLEVRNFPIELDETTVATNSSRVLSHQGYIYISQTTPAAPEEAAIVQAKLHFSLLRLQTSSFKVRIRSGRKQSTNKEVN